MSYELKQMEVRKSTELVKGIPKLKVTGYTATANNPYTYKNIKNKEGVLIRSLKEVFSEKGLNSLYKKLKANPIFVDAMHKTAAQSNIRHYLDSIKSKSSVNVDDEINDIMSLIKVTDEPLFKVEKIDVDEVGIKVEVETNPAYALIDSDHKNYYDYLVYSLENGFLNKMSLNFNPVYSSYKLVGTEAIPQIDDVDVYGISIMHGGANDGAPDNIVEMAVRSAIETIRGSETMEMRTTTEVQPKQEVDLVRMKEELKNELLKEMEENRKVVAERENQIKTVEELKSLKEQLSKSEQEKDFLKKQTEELKSVRESSTKGSSGIVKTENSSSFKDFGPEIDSPNKHLIKVTGNSGQIKEGIRNYLHSKSPTQKSFLRANGTDGKLGFGEALFLQAEFNTLESLPAETKAHLGKGADIVVKR